MSVKWYFSLDGELFGPVDSDNLLELLASGEINSGTMILAEGEEKWRPLAEVKELFMGGEDTHLGERSRPHTFILESSAEPAELSTSKPFLGTSEPTVTKAAPGADAQWVILKGVQEDGKERFLQEGPYPTSEVLQKLKTGELRYSDHCWRDGMGEWKALRDEPTFASTPLEPIEGSVHLNSPVETDIEIPKSVPLEDIGSVQFSSTEVHSMALAESPPPEALGEDLAGAEEDFSFTDESIVAPSPIPSGAEEQSQVGTSPFLAEESAVMELEQLEKSVVKKPISSPLDQIEKPKLIVTPEPEPDAEPVKVQEVGSLRRPHLQAKILEAQMAQSRSRPRSSGGMSRLIIILAGAFLLLMFGLQLAKDLAR